MSVKLLRLWLLVAFVSLVLLSLGPARRVEAQPGTVQRISPGIWFREGEQPAQAKSNEMKDSGHCNNVFIEMEDYLIVVDANFPSGAKLALADARKISTKPVRYVFDTHHHADHAYGNPIWTRNGATTLAHQGVVDAMRRVEPRRWLETAAAREDVRQLNLRSAELPLETFSESPHVLSDGTRRVEFHHFGWGHTRGDGFVYLPREKILCTGDAVVNGPFNYMLDANIKNWPNVLRAARNLDLEIILPGHGAPADAGLLSGQIRFLEAIYQAVEVEMRRGKTLVDLVKFDKGVPVAASLRLPEGLSDWVGHLFPGQVHMIYEEISQGKPHGDIVAGD